jgi:hypothetical protein
MSPFIAPTYKTSERCKTSRCKTSRKAPELTPDIRNISKKKQEGKEWGQILGTNLNFSTGRKRTLEQCQLLYSGEYILYAHL